LGDPGGGYWSLVKESSREETKNVRSKKKTSAGRGRRGRSEDMGMRPQYFLLIKVN
jgi:hypothetical protein